MQQNDNQTALERERTHTKLFMVDGRQVSAFLNRDDSDDLIVVLQLWVAATDETLRVAITFDSEEIAQEVFNDLNDESLPLVLEQTGITEMLRG